METMETEIRLLKGAIAMSSGNEKENLDPVVCVLDWHNKVTYIATTYYFQWYFIWMVLHCIIHEVNPCLDGLTSRKVWLKNSSLDDKTQVETEEEKGPGKITSSI